MFRTQLPFQSILFAAALFDLAEPFTAQGQTTFTFQQSSTYDQGGSTIRADNPNLNQGVSGTYTPGQIASGADLRAVFSFPLTGLSLGMSISSVQLTLTTNADPASENATFTLQLFQLTSTFLEPGVSWNSRDGTNAWTTAGGDFSSTLLSSVTANPTVSNTLTFDSSPAFVSAVQGAVDAGTPFYFIMKLDSTGESGNVRRIFSTNSDDAASVSQRPVLTVTTAAVPEPTTFALVGTGVVGLLAWRRRRPGRSV